jgi:hypothetical protein
MALQRATRKQAKLRLAMCGPAGSGKSYTALLVAKGLISALAPEALSATIADSDIKVGVIDSERRSSELYAHLLPFVPVHLSPPYSVEKYAKALDELEAHGCLVGIIDQISHAWAGPGGVLEYVDALKSSARNGLSPWQKATPKQHEFIDRILRSPMHIIVTMRSKTEWVIEEQINQRGEKKQVPRKVGMAPVQREGVEFEFTTMLDMDSGEAAPTKDRTGLFGEIGTRQRLDETTGVRLAAWLNEGDEYVPPPPKDLPPGTYVKPANYVEPPDPMPKVKEALDDMVDNGFPPDPEPMVSLEQMEQMAEACKVRAKAIGMKGKNAYVELCLAALKEFEVEKRHDLPVRHLEAFLDLVAHWELQA